MSELWNNIFRYYGVDWLLFLFVLIHLWMLGNRWKSGFIVGCFACVCGFLFGMQTLSPATLMMNFVFFLMHLRAYWRWTIAEREAKDGQEERIKEVVDVPDLQPEVGLCGDPVSEPPFH